MSKIETARKSIEHALYVWSGADWTHEAQDTNGNYLDNRHGERLYCNGELDDCDVCRRATADAARANRLGEQALVELADGRVGTAFELIREARYIENAWGDDPTWRPALRAMIAMIAVESGGE